MSNAHHEDYDKPLEVTWLCHKHHFEASQRTSEIETKLNMKILLIAIIVAVLAWVGMCHVNTWIDKQAAARSHQMEEITQ